MRHAVRLLAVASMLLAGPLFGQAADAAELKVVSAGAMRAVLEQLGPEFEKSSGHKLSIEYATAGKVEEKVLADDTVDVAILTKPRADKLVRSAKLVGGTAATLAKAQIGLAVKKGAPKPDISSVDAFKKALLAAKSVAYTDPASGATSGIHIAQVIEKLGVAAELKPKTKLVSASAGQGSPLALRAGGQGRGRTRHAADQRIDGGPRYRRGRSVAGRIAEPGPGLCRGLALYLGAADRGQGLDRFPQRPEGGGGIQG